MKNWDPGLAPSFDGFVQTPNSGDLTDENKRLRARISILNARIDQLLRQTDRDELTNLSNRRAFGVDLNRAIGRCRRYGIPTALIFLDLDRHDMSDAALERHTGDQISVIVAQILRTNIRSLDTVARLRGDEFAVLMDHLTLEAAKQKTAQLVATVTEALAEQTDTAATLHWGVAMLLPEDTISEAMTRADFALFEDRAAQRSER